MKRLLSLITVLACFYVNVFSQATSLTVDCQNPGWLSNMILYKDMQTVKNLKVTGSINDDDLNFLRKLNTEFNLCGVLDLEDVSFVATKITCRFSSSKTSYSTSYESYNNTLPPFAFAEYNQINKIILPQSLTGFERNHRRYFSASVIDTLVVNGDFGNKTLIMNEYLSGSSAPQINCIYINEGLRNLLFVGFLNTFNEKTFTLYLPSSIESFGFDESLPNPIIIHSLSSTPETIKLPSKCKAFKAGDGIIYVPKGAKEKYLESIFKELIIIENIPVENIILQENDKYVHLGETVIVTATISPSDALHQEITYEVSDSNIISVSETGAVTGKAFGQAYVYAFSYNKEYKDSCLVSVFEHTTGVTIPEKDTLKVGGTKELVATTLPQGTSDNRVVYTSKNI